LTQEANVTPIVILNKCDLIDDLALYISLTLSCIGNIPLHVVSATTGKNMESLLEYFKDDTTAVLLGSSGAGKSSITNWLLQTKVQNVSKVRDDDSRCRHTTTSSQLFPLPCGGYLIDAPGMRELAIINFPKNEKVFEQIEQLSLQCRFSNCDHEQSQGCAIMEALKRGDIDERQLKNYQKTSKTISMEKVNIVQILHINTNKVRKISIRGNKRYKKVILQKKVFNKYKYLIYNILNCSPRFCLKILRITSGDTSSYIRNSCLYIFPVTVSK